MIYARPIKQLENVATGIAEFEGKIREFHAAGSKRWRGHDELKTDLMAILPKELKKHTVVLQAQLDHGKSYEIFSQMVRA